MTNWWCVYVRICNKTMQNKQETEGQATGLTLRETVNFYNVSFLPYLTMQHRTSIYVKAQPSLWLVQSELWLWTRLWSESKVRIVSIHFHQDNPSHEVIRLETLAILDPRDWSWILIGFVLLNHTEDKRITCRWFCNVQHLDSFWDLQKLWDALACTDFLSRVQQRKRWWSLKVAI